MLQNPNFNALKMFDAAARHLNFGLAAEELNLTQGAVAQQVRKLEKELDVKLFYRLARGLELTEQGRNYSRSVRKAIKIIEEATLKLQVQNESLKLSVPPSLASKWLLPRLKLFNQLYPEIKVEIIASEVRANFKNDGVDLAIRMGQPPFGNELKEKLLALQNLCAVCSQNYAQKLNKINQVEDLADYQLIYDDHSQWDAFISNLQGGNQGGNNGMKFNQTALAMDAALNGQGIALVPFLLAEADIAKGNLVKLWRDEEPNVDGYYIITADLSTAKPQQQAMIDWLLAQIKT